MKVKIPAFLSLLVAAIALSGCMSTVDGGKRAGIGPGMKNTVEARFERDLGQIYDASKEVLRYNGTLTQENRVNNSLTAKIDTRTIYVRVAEVGPNVTQLLVQAMKRGGWPDVDLASEIKTQIALKL